MKDAAYWRGRFSILEQQSHALAEQTIREMEAAYMEAAVTVQRELEAWYLRFAKNNEMSLAEARKRLNTRELEEFRWTVEQYVAKGESLDPQWKKQMENASCKFHISRLEAIKLEIQQQIELLYGNQLDALDALLTEITGEGYTRTAYEIQKGLGVGWRITKPDQKGIDTLLTKPWTTDMRTFRDRCWVNKEALVDSVHKKLTQAILRGDSPAKTTAAIQKEFQVSRYKARRLVHTETSYFRALSDQTCYRDLGVDSVEILETLDSRTCPICGSMDGKVIPLAQVEPGVTVPPYHPNCRGTTCPHFDDMREGKRAARGKDGKTYYVPEGMTYAEWKKGALDGKWNAASREKHYADITGHWFPDSKPDSHPVRDLMEYRANGVTYKVDGHNVVLDYSSEEKEIAELLKREVGGEICMVPRVNNPQGVSTPDYLFHGQAYDLKTLKPGATENTIYNRVKKAKSQSKRFVIDVTKGGLSEEIIKKQIEKIFWSTETEFVETVVIVNDSKINFVFERKK